MDVQLIQYLIDVMIYDKSTSRWDNRPGEDSSNRERCH